MTKHIAPEIDGPERTGIGRSTARIMREWASKYRPSAIISMPGEAPPIDAQTRRPRLDYRGAIAAMRLGNAL